MALPPILGYWRDFGTRYVTALCALPDIGDAHDPPAVPAPPASELDSLAASVPPMAGAEYLTGEVLHALWSEIDAALRNEVAAAKTGVQSFLAKRSPSWHLVGRVYFNLAEHRKDEDAPFAFLATYTTRLSASAKPQHLPLGRALSEYAGTANKSRLLSLLLPVQRAGEQCPWLRQMLADGDHLFPAALDSRRSAATAQRPAAPRVVWRHRSCAERMAGQTSAASASERDGRHQAACRCRRRGAARLSYRRDARRRDADGDGDRAAARRAERAADGSRPLGRARCRQARAHARHSQARRAGQGQGRPQFRRGHASGRRRRRSGGGRRGSRCRRLVAHCRGSLVIRYAAVAAAAGCDCRCRSWPCASCDAAALSAGRAPLAAPAVHARPGCVPGRRHGARQDHAGAGAVAGREKFAVGGPGSQRACRACVASRQLGVGDRAVRSGSAGDRRASVGYANARLARAGPRARRWHRSGHHELRIAAARSGADENPVAPRDLRRGAGHQESRRETDTGRAAARGAGSHRADRYAGGESSRRPVVDLRCDQSGAAGHRASSSRRSPNGSPGGRAISTRRCAI